MQKNFLDADDLAQYLYECTVAYDNGEPLIPDALYDELEHDLKRIKPDHPFLQRVGSEVRGGKVKLPHPMLGIEQVYVGDLFKWMQKNGLTNKDLVVSEKMDGTSALICYDAYGRLSAAFSRGNGYEGADITRHLKRMKNAPPMTIPKEFAPQAVRVEIEVPEKDFEKINAMGLNDSSEDGTFANARNFTAGQMNREVALEAFYEHVQAVAYTIVGSNLPKTRQLTLLKEQGFTVTKWWKAEHFTPVLQGLEEELMTQLAKCKAESPLALDGFVITVNTNPHLQVKFKVEDASNFAQAKVVKVHWRDSRHGSVKPRVEIEPVPLSGVTVTFATGFHGKFIFDNKIGPGAIVEITRKGEVIPYILKVVKGTTADMPGEEGIDWLWDGVECKNIGTTDEQVVNRFKHFFHTLGVANAGEGTAKALVAAGIYEVATSVRLAEHNWQDLLGKANGTKVYEGLKKALNPVDLCKLADASCCYPAGCGERTFNAIVAELGDFRKAGMLELCTVSGIGDTTAQKIVEGNEAFYRFLEEISAFYSLKGKVEPSSDALKGTVVEFTGVRRKDLEEKIISMGGTIGSKFNVLICKDPSGDSGKLKKAREKGIRILSVGEAEEWLGAAK